MLAGVTALEEDECDAYETADMDSDPTLCGIWDTGCRRRVAGSDVLQPIKQRLQELGYPLVEEPSTQSFRFGKSRSAYGERGLALAVRYLREA